MGVGPGIAGHVGGNGKMHAPFEIGSVAFFEVSDFDARRAGELVPWNSVRKHAGILPGFAAIGNAPALASWLG